MDYKVHNKTDMPDNIVENQNKIIDKSIEIQHSLPFFMRDFFIYLKSSVAISSRRAYLTDILFFCEYLVNETDLTDETKTKNIKIETFNNMKARDINYFLGEYCTRYFVETKNSKYIMKNNNRTLSRKRSSLTVLFKFLYRNEQIENNITEGLNPIKLPKLQPDAIKKLEIDEVAKMLKAVENGEGLSDKQKQYWEKTKHRDKAIIMLFVTYGLRLSELQQLNVDSFSFKRGTFKIYRKRDKIVDMPINKSVEKSIKTYLNMERNTNTAETALFLSLQNQRMSTRAIRKLIKKYTAIGMETSYENGYSPHKLRATAATSLLEHGFSIYDVKSLLDHDNVTTTQLYASHRKNAKRNIIKNFELDDEY
ncbi:tyrosine-type recombinase/integrase [Clostridiaceae bacterium HSG29]|nr:tyrosine-type recombinase/integrase [Clostridiaceae bacterium HSG29]